MRKLKVCIDLGGTKTIISLVDDKFKFYKIRYEDTPRNRKEILNLFDSVKLLSKFTDTLNMSVPGRVTPDGKIIDLPNVNLAKGFNLKLFFKRYFKNVNIMNDASSAALKAIYDKKLDNGLLITWGTGIGGAIVINRRLFLGGGSAGEIGHMYSGQKEIESLIGGKAMKSRFGMDGKTLHCLALKNDRRALSIFNQIGNEFGYFLTSLIYAFDPSQIVIIGSFTNSWKFMKDSVYEVLNKRIMKRKITINVIKDRFYTLKGVYLIDNYAANDN